MKELFEKNRIFLAIILGAMIISAGVYFGLSHYARSDESRQNYGNVKVSEKGSENYFVDNQPVFKSVAKVDNIDNGKCLAGSEVLVTKVIDGDTIVVEGGYNIRLLAIDTDEIGYPCYESAKTRLEELILNKKIILEKDKTDVDKYKRCLRYVFLGKENIDLQLVKEGLAVARFYEPDVKYKKEITFAEKTAIDEKVGCKWKNL